VASKSKRLKVSPSKKQIHKREAIPVNWRIDADVAKALAEKCAAEGGLQGRVVSIALRTLLKEEGWLR